MKKIIFSTVSILIVVSIVFLIQTKSKVVATHSSSDAGVPKLTVVPPLQFTPSQSQAIEAVNSIAASTPKFSALGVLKRNAILSEIGKQDFASIFKIWIDAGRVEHDLMKQGAVATILGNAMRYRTPAPEIFSEIQNFILDSSNSSLERAELLGVLAQAATKESTESLMRVEGALTDKEINQIALTSIGTLGTGFGGANQESLAPVLDQVWRESNDKALVLYTAMAMAQVGAPSSMKMLLDAALASSEGITVKTGAAKNALLLANILNPNAVPLLAARLENQSPTSMASKLVAPILVKMVSNPAAGNAVLNWLQGTGENAAPLIHDLVIQQTRDETMLAVWATALDPTVSFRNEQNREAIRAGLIDLTNQIKALNEKRMKLTEEKLQKLNPEAAALVQKLKANQEKMMAERKAQLEAMQAQYKAQQEAVTAKPASVPATLEPPALAKP